jgi:hypothetical protein
MLDVNDLPKFASDIAGLVRLATDTSTTLDERRNAALAACTLVERSGLLDELTKLTSSAHFKSLKKLIALRALMGDE